MLIGHTHWDHIQGFPFFAPLGIPGNNWSIYGPRGAAVSLRDVLAGQMEYTYFPLTLDNLNATTHYHDLVEGSFEVGDIKVTAQYLNHPALTLGYRLEVDGVVLVYATDHEPHSRQRALGEGGPPVGEDTRHARFLADADLLIHDAQYTAQEYPEKMGWGHSTIEYVVDTAVFSHVRRLALFHHDPTREDAAVDGLVKLAHERAAESGRELEIFASAEGAVLDLDRAPQRKSRFVASGRATARPANAVSRQLVLIRIDDPAAADVLAAAAEADGLELAVAENEHATLELVRSKRPSLILIDATAPGPSARETCRAIRDLGDAYANDVAIVFVRDCEDGAEQRLDSEAGVNDWLIKPFTEVYARTRLRAWLLRTACRWVRAKLPPDEPERLRSLHATGILDSEPEERFDRYTRIAASLFQVPIAIISLVDTDRQWFKSCVGLDATETTRDMAFCAHAILNEEGLQVCDALLDPRFADNPLVTGGPRVRFYAGVPLRLDDGSKAGTLCLIDHRPRTLDEKQFALLRDFANLVEREMRP
jgi:phosphoribosyl 1,2-cyclic phosphodiesterase/CheY-like chemotaxis protein